MQNRPEHATTVEGWGAIVTGASRGLGRALAIELARGGARVAMVARDSAELERAARDVAEQTGHAPVTIVADIADKRAIHRIAALSAELLGRVDLLIHNASTLGPLPMPLLLDLACEDLATVLETNLVGPFRLSKLVASGMALRRRGTIVFVSSDAAVSAYPGWGAYGVSKAAADHLARSFAAELGDQGVRVIAVDPTEMDTAMHAQALPEADRSTLAQPSAVARAICQLIAEPLRAPSGARVIALPESA